MLWLVDCKLIRRQAICSSLASTISHAYGYTVSVMGMFGSSICSVCSGIQQLFWLGALQTETNRYLSIDMKFKQHNFLHSNTVLTFLPRVGMVTISQWNFYSTMCKLPVLYTWPIQCDTTLYYSTVILEWVYICYHIHAIFYYFYKTIHWKFSVYFSPQDWATCNTTLLLGPEWTGNCDRHHTYGYKPVTCLVNQLILHALWRNGARFYNSGSRKEGGGGF